MALNSETKEEKFARYLEDAEHGASSFQVFLASMIIADANYPDRMVEALKWVYISKCLKDTLADDNIISFLTRGMTDQEVERALNLVDAWVESKINEAHDESIDPESLDWSKELQELTGLTVRKEAIKAKLANQ